jgi:hypothetical protein
MTQRQTGWMLIGLAAGTLLLNLADAVNDLQTWHGLTAPSFVAVVMRQTGSVVLAGFGGKLLPSK